MAKPSSFGKNSTFCLSDATNSAGTKLSFILPSGYVVYLFNVYYLCASLKKQMEVVAQSVRASVCGTEGRGFETPHPPMILEATPKRCLFFFVTTTGVVASVLIF
jgi:hypothetical protein